MLKKKHILFIIILAGLIACPGYAQLSQAITFFTFNYCGSGQTASWRGSCHLNDKPVGGYHDAGDHVKFGLPLAFTMATLAWANYEYGISAGAQISRGLTYMKACVNGSSITYQVGDPGPDHSYWGPPENDPNARPSYTTTQASCVLASTAAAFAIAAAGGSSGGDINLARQLFAAAEAAKSDAGYTAANGFYTSSSGFYDELIWAAVWIYIATNDRTYLTRAESYVGNLNTDYQWTYCWDDCRYGAILKLAQITAKPEYIAWIEKYLDFWMPGGGVTYTPGGLPWRDSWGVLRYASATAFLAKLWGDYPLCTPSKASTYRSFATRVLNYIKGSNPRNSSYIIGYGSNYPRCPHHRAACPVQNECAVHELTGALVGGPDQSDQYNDNTSNYAQTEVAIDYNACLVAALAAQTGTSHRVYPTPTPTPTPTLPPTATPGNGNGLLGEYYDNIDLTGLKLTRTDAIIDFNWGGSAPDTGMTADQFSVRWTGQVQARYTDTHTFYLLSDDGSRLWVNNQLIIDDWRDHAASSEYMTQGTTTLELGKKYDIKVEYYDSGADASIQLFWSTPWLTREIIPRSQLYSTAVSSPTPPPTATPTYTAPRLGDVNNNGNVDINDAMLTAQYAAGMNPPHFNIGNADVNRDSRIDINDALLIARYSAGLISSF